MTTREIPLAGIGGVALVDAADYDRIVARGRWYAYMHVRRAGSTGKPYVQTRVAGKTVYLHRFILDAPPRVHVDHIDGDPLNNTRANLRLCTASENQANIPKLRSGKSSPFKGVSWDTGNRKWIATLQRDGRNVLLRRFDSETEAARAYDAAALEHFGPFARVNLPNDIQANHSTAEEAA